MSLSYLWVPCNYLMVFITFLSSPSILRHLLKCAKHPVHLKGTVIVIFKWPLPVHSRPIHNGKPLSVQEWINFYFIFSWISAAETMNKIVRINHFRLRCILQIQFPGTILNYNSEDPCTWI